MGNRLTGREILFLANYYGVADLPAVRAVCALVVRGVIVFDGNRGFLAASAQQRALIDAQRDLYATGGGKAERDFYAYGRGS